MPQEYSFNDTEKQRYFAIQKIFQKFDTDGTGTLDVRELQVLLKNSDLVFEKEQIEEIFKILDADGSCHITIDEF